MLNRPKVPALDRSPVPPEVERRDSVQIAHGVALTDPYAWLRAENWQEVLRDPGVLPDDIRAVLEAENRYADAVLAPIADLRRELQDEMRKRIKEDDASVPVPDGPFDYYTRHRENGQHEIVCRRLRAGGDEQILLDGDLLAEGKAFLDIGDAQYSPDHRLLAWTVDDRGSELYAIRVRDLVTGQDLADLVPQTDGHAVWAADAQGFYYVRVDDNHRAHSVHFHALGTSETADRLVLDEPDPGWFVSIHGTRSKRFCAILVHNHDSSEAHLVDLERPDAPPLCVSERQPGIRYELDHRRDSLFILTNAGGAEDFKIVEARLAHPTRPSGGTWFPITRAG